MRIKLYGVRGSIASPSTDTVYYGGNTACVYVEGDDGTHLIFDAGTGIRELGQDIPADKQPLYLFFSHYHWDHIQGFPFFQPVYQADREVYLLSDHLAKTPDSILGQMATPHFPVPAAALKAQIKVKPIQQGYIQLGDLRVSTLAANHPGGCCAYRVDSPQGSFAYVTDNELSPPGEPTTTYSEWLFWLQGVDLLLHDAMYLDDEREGIHGWGHSLISQTLQLAADANVKNVVLFHHDPSRTDKQLNKIADDSKQWMSQHSLDCKVHLARELDVYHLSEHEEVRQSR